MAGSAARTVTVRVTDEHLRKIIEQHLLKQEEISDPVKLGRVVQKSLDAALGLPDLHGTTGMSGGRG